MNACSAMCSGMATDSAVRPLTYFDRPGGTKTRGEVVLTDDVQRLLNANCVVALAVSGGKDSQAMAIAASRHLDRIGHTGPRVLIHADLGSVEWKDSLPCCERLAMHLGLELITVRRPAGGLMERWQGRWENNVKRYRELSCVKLILPWSTPSMRFCTSELKVDVITRALKKRFPGQQILNVSGIRRQESTARSRMPISSLEKKLTRKGLEGYTWNAIIEFQLEQVFGTIDDAGLALHEAYTRYKSSRVSCRYCIMGSIADLNASVACEDNHAAYVDVVTLEADSTFAFQGNRWLADVAPHLLSDDLRRRVARAKEAAIERQRAEEQVSKHLLYTKGWPTTMPTRAEAELLARVRREVAAAVGLDVADYVTADSVVERYAQLMDLQRVKLQAVR